jgi:putative flippase GtrA
VSTRQEELFKYSLIGVISFLIDYIFLFILESKVKIDVMPSVIFAFLLSACFNFYMNFKYTFRMKSSSLSVYLIKYIATVIVSLILTVAIVNLFMEVGLYVYTSKLISVIILFIINFYLSKNYIYRI